MSAMVPDFENGYMVMAHDSPNRWRTGIECVLTRSKDGAEIQHAYLSHECRAENVASEIFDDRCYEFVAAKLWSGDYYLRGGSYNYGFNPFRNLRKSPPECTYEKLPDENIFVHCPMRSPRYLDFDEALESLQSENDGKRKKLFMKVTFRHSGFNYALYAPSRYINYPHPELGPELGEGRYIQPISGLVLFDEGAVARIAYVAAHMRETATETVEFNVRDMVSFIGTKNKSSRLFPIFKIFDKLLFSAFFTMDDFCSVRRFPDGDCRLFVYEPPS